MALVLHGHVKFVAEFADEGEAQRSNRRHSDLDGFTAKEAKGLFGTIGGGDGLQKLS